VVGTNGNNGLRAAHGFKAFELTASSTPFQLLLNDMEECNDIAQAT
jgi:hypothetical protein